MTETDPILWIGGIILGCVLIIFGWLMWKRERSELLGWQFESIYNHLPDGDKKPFLAVVGIAGIVMGAGCALGFVLCLYSVYIGAACIIVISFLIWMGMNLYAWK